MKISLYFILVIIWNIAISQTLTVTYKDISPNPFAGYSASIGIGIMKFIGEDGYEAKIYDELKKIPGIHDKFMIFPYKVLQDQKDVLKLKTLNFNDRKAQKSLFDNLDIMFLISGELSSNDKLKLQIVRTTDGVIVFEDDFKNSSQSTAIKDAVKVISENKRSEYKGGKGKTTGYFIEWSGVGFRKLLGGRMPVYPEGTDKGMPVLLQFTVLADGSIRGIIPLNRSDEILEREAVAALRTWLFDPLPPQHDQVVQIGKVTFIFKLE